MKVLVTGFDAFGGEVINPALEAIRGLPARLDGIEIATAELPTIFGRALDRLDAAIRREAPEIVLAIGQAGGRAGLSLERVAINLDDARIADNAGNAPIDLPVIPGGPAAYFTNLPVKAMAQAMRAAGVPTAISFSAGTFLCNHVFYGLMHGAATRYPGLRGGFMHIPYLPQQAARHPGAPSMSVDLVRAGIAIALATAATVERDYGGSEGVIA